MSYPKRGAIGNFFIPNLPLATTTTAPVLLEMDIGATSADHGEMICIRACTLRLAGFICVGELAGGTVTAPTVVFTKRPTPLSASGEVVASTLTIPDATAVGAAIVDSDVAVDFAVGDSLEISHTVGVGTPTGIGFWFAECEDNPEVIENNTEVTETA
jgi:hypothetical protein